MESMMDDVNYNPEGQEAPQLDVLERENSSVRALGF